jgi:Muramidase (phage lambda lysozyme)
MAVSESPRMGALLDQIARAESNSQPNVIYGGTTFNDYSDHPRQYVPIVSGPNQGLKSSGAGSFQFIAPTWDIYKEKLNLPDFSPESQRIAAAELARDDYKKRTGRDLDVDLESDDPKIQQDIFRNLNKTWTSIPGGIEERPDSNWASVWGAPTMKQDHK